MRLPLFVVAITLSVAPSWASHEAEAPAAAAPPACLAFLAAAGLPGEFALERLDEGARTASLTLLGASLSHAEWVKVSRHAQHSLHGAWLVRDQASARKLKTFFENEQASHHAELGALHRFNRRLWGITIAVDLGLAALSGQLGWNVVPAVVGTWGVALTLHWLHWHDHRLSTRAHATVRKTLEALEHSEASHPELIYSTVQASPTSLGALGQLPTLEHDAHSYEQSYVGFDVVRAHERAAGAPFYLIFASGWKTRHTDSSGKK